METKATCICFCTFVEVYLLTYKQVKLQRLLAMVCWLTSLVTHSSILGIWYWIFRGGKKEITKYSKQKGWVHHSYGIHERDAEWTRPIGNPVKHKMKLSSSISQRLLPGSTDTSEKVTCLSDKCRTLTLLGQCPILFFVSIFKMQKS